MIPRAFHQYVALGDSFTEGVGDPALGRPNGVRGWADRVAEALALDSPEFGYANLAIRGRKLAQVVEEQVDVAMQLDPDLVTFAAGVNDLLRPRADIDALVALLDDAVVRLKGTGATVVLFSIADSGSSGAFAAIRGRAAIFNELLREVVDRRGAMLVDVWRLREVRDPRLWNEDRLHLAPAGHQEMAMFVLDTLGVPHALHSVAQPERPRLSERERRWQNVRWARAHAAPWVHRRLTGRSSGDGVTPKRPALLPIDAPA